MAGLAGRVGGGGGSCSNVRIHLAGFATATVTAMSEMNPLPGVKSLTREQENRRAMVGKVG